MTVKEKLEAIKAMEDKNRAVDQAFALGQKSVQPMKEFTTEELQVLCDLTGTKGDTMLCNLRNRIQYEIDRRKQ